VCTGWSVGAGAHRGWSVHKAGVVHGWSAVCTSAPDADARARCTGGRRCARVVGGCPCTPGRGWAHGARCARAGDAVHERSGRTSARGMPVHTGPRPGARCAVCTGGDAVHERDGATPGSPRRERRGAVGADARKKVASAHPRGWCTSRAARADVRRRPCTPGRARARGGRCARAAGAVHGTSRRPES